MKHAAAILAFALVMFASCATATAYTGPVSDRPLIAVTSTKRLMPADPRLPEQLTTTSIAAVTATALRLNATSVAATAHVNNMGVFAT